MSHTPNLEFLVLQPKTAWLDVTQPHLIWPHQTQQLPKQELSAFLSFLMCVSIKFHVGSIEFYMRWIHLFGVKFSFAYCMEKKQ